MVIVLEKNKKMIKNFFNWRITRSQFIVRFFISLVIYLTSYLYIFSLREPGSKTLFKLVLLFYFTLLYITSLYVRRLCDAGQSVFLAVFLVLGIVFVSVIDFFFIVLVGIPYITIGILVPVFLFLCLLPSKPQGQNRLWWTLNQ